MGSKAESDLQKLLRERAKEIIDPAGRVVRVLEDEKAMRTANELGCALHEVYRQALLRGITPYRYSRNREGISLEEQLRLAESRVSVIGCGGLGGHMIMLLARIGIGHLVVDHDHFDETNLNRQILSNMESTDKAKSEQAVDVVRSVNPGVEVTSYHAKLDASNPREILTGSHVVVDALDNVPARFLLESAAKALSIPLLHGAVAGFDGRVMTIFPEDPGLKNLYMGGGPAPDDPKRPEAVLGVPTITPAIFGAYQAMEVLKIILERGKIFRNVMLHMDLERGQLSEFFFEPAGPNLSPS